jgi:peptide/nickel transport system permease protein
MAPHVSTIPGIALMLAIVALNLLGDGLRDTLDPRLRR